MARGVKIGSTLKEFEAIARQFFGFLEDEAGMKRGVARVVNEGSPRDEVFVLRYSRDDMRVNIGWKANELALISRVRLNRSALSRREHDVYFESYIEFISRGAEKAIVPFREGPGSRQPFMTCMKQRQRLFEEGLPPVMEALAAKVRNRLPDLEAATPETVRAYHAWIAKEEAR